MIVLAHRGLHDDARENTLAAFEAAVAAGVDGIETDVRLSKDGVAVLVHDPKIGRRKVAAMTHAEISLALGHHVPSLAEALLRFDVFWNVEIKSKDAVPAAIRVLRRHEGDRRLLVTSFRADIVARVAKALHVECGRIIARRPVAPRRNAGRAVVWQFRLASEKRVRREHAAGRRVFVYGPRTPADHRRCVASGVDGVITDRPGLL